MTLQASGPIRMSEINHEIGQIADTGMIWMDHDWLRTLAGKPGSGTRIAFGDFYSRSWYVTMTAQGTDGFSEGTSSGTTSSTITTIPRVSVQNGSGGYTYLWSFTDAQGCDILPGTETTAGPSVRRLIGKFGGYYTATLQVVITDNTGHQMTVGGIRAIFQWDSPA